MLVKYQGRMSFPFKLQLFPAEDERDSSCPYETPHNH
jgi:hypothetical protein